MTNIINVQYIGLLLVVKDTVGEYQYKSLAK